MTNLTLWGYGLQSPLKGLKNVIQHFNRDGCNLKLIMYFYVNSRYLLGHYEVNINKFHYLQRDSQLEWNRLKLGSDCDQHRYILTMSVWWWKAYMSNSNPYCMKCNFKSTAYIDPSIEKRYHHRSEVTTWISPASLG